MEERHENTKEKIICNTCMNDTFRVYIGVSIDDARMYCTRCGKDPGLDIMSDEELKKN